jgi:IclR family transcriptional regulator, acetate operon repressor
VHKVQQSSSTLQTADRALQVLQQFRLPGDTLAVGELADRLGIHRSTASRLVSTLEARGFLARTAGERVQLGPETERLGRIALGEPGLLEFGRPILESLAQATGEVITLAVPAGAEVLTVAESASTHFVSSRNWVGVKTPAHCAADGKVLLSFGAIAEPPRSLVAMTPRTITDHRLLGAELAAVRRQGFAVARGELEEGLNGLAAPVWDSASCVGALCVSGPEYRLYGEFEHVIGPACVAAAAELTRRLRAEIDPPRDE